MLDSFTDDSVFEGDIEIDETDDLGNDNVSLSDFTTHKEYKWDTKVGPFLKIPFTIPDGLCDQDKAQIARAVQEFRSKTCVR